MTDLIESTLRGLGGQLPGRTSRPGDDRYAAATAIWAKPVGLMPRMVVHCRTISDIQLAISAARSAGLALSVRGGGHDWAGRALCDGLVLDLSGMRDVQVSPDRRSARISGGARAVDVLTATDPLGLAAVTGSCSAVGMAGLTLGGGYGPLIGRFGLALDNLIAADIVLADGRIVTAEPGNEEDLFWALRGGGGNFGVVAEMRIRLHELPNVVSGVLVYPFSEAGTVLRRFAEIAPSLPDELTVQVCAVAGPDGAPVILLVPTWSGRQGGGDADIVPLLELGTLLDNSVDAVRYGASLSVFDPFILNGQRVFMETCSLPALNEDAAEIIVEAMAKAVSAGCAILTHDFKGAASRVPVEATAFGLRRDHVLIEILASFPDLSDRLEERRHQHWVRDTRQAFKRIALPGGYPNLLGAGEADRAAASFGPNAERLAMVKRHYDPGNVFSSAIPLPPHQNPAAAGKLKVHSSRERKSMNDPHKFGTKFGSDNAPQHSAAIVSHHDSIKWFEAIPGEQLCIRVHGTQVNGRYAIMENIAAPGTATPMHFHAEDEIFHILEGTVTFSIDGDVFNASVGSIVVIPAGAHHAWRNRSNSPIRMSTFFSPGGVEELYPKLVGLSLEELSTVVEPFGSGIVGPPIDE